MSLSFLCVLYFSSFKLFSLLMSHLFAKWNLLVFLITCAKKFLWLTKSSRFHGFLKLGLLCPITESLRELGTNVVVTSSKEDICRVLKSKWPRSEKGEIILSERDTKTTQIQRNMSLSDSSSERSFNSEDSEANLAEVEDEQSDRESQVACESLDSFCGIFLANRRCFRAAWRLHLFDDLKQESL